MSTYETVQILAVCFDLQHCCEPLVPPVLFFPPVNLWILCKRTSKVSTLLFSSAFQQFFHTTWLNSIGVANIIKTLSKVTHIYTLLTYTKQHVQFKQTTAGARSSMLWFGLCCMKQAGEEKKINCRESRKIKRCLMMSKRWFPAIQWEIRAFCIVLSLFNTLSNAAPTEMGGLKENDEWYNTELYSVFVNNTWQVVI